MVIIGGRARRRHGRPARHRELPLLPGKALGRRGEHGSGAHARLARRRHGAALAHGDHRRRWAPRRSARLSSGGRARTRDGGAEVVPAWVRVLDVEAAVRGMVRAILNDDEQIELPSAAAFPASTASAASTAACPRGSAGAASRRSSRAGSTRARRALCAAPPRRCATRDSDLHDLGSCSAERRRRAPSSPGAPAALPASLVDAVRGTLL